VNEVVGVGGFIIPDARVDVVLTTAPAQGSGRISKIVLENIQVLAAGQAVDRKDNKPVTVNTVTVAVTPEDAEKLALAVGDGRINLALRNFIDNASVATTGVDKNRLLASRYSGPPIAEGQETPKPKRSARKKAPPPLSAPAAIRTGHEVEVLKGTKRSVEKFD
jgi:pilus assembly protein CpaB